MDDHQTRYMALSDVEAPVLLPTTRQQRQARFGSPPAYGHSSDRRSRSTGAAAAAASSRGQLIGNLGGLQQPRAAMKIPSLLPTSLQAKPNSLPSQKPVQLRQRDKIVLLPRSASSSDTAAEAGQPPSEQQQQQQLDLAEQQQQQEQQQQHLASSSIFEDLAPPHVAPPADSRGRVTVYCIAEALLRPQLEALIAARYPEAQVTSDYTEVLHMALPVPAGSDPADAYFFDYGVVCFWGFSAKQEAEVLAAVARKAQQQPLPPREVEKDSFEYAYSARRPPAMQNDTITISRHHAGDHQVKLAICHALAQSTKLCIYEERVLELVVETKHLPQALALHGTVHVASGEIARRIGQVFLQRSAVNLLSSVLDTPDFFWSVPDHLQVLYERACDYLELSTRVEVLNARFQVLQEMLDMLRDHQANHHNVRLELIIIWLIVVEVVVGLLELMGLFGLFKERG